MGAAEYATDDRSSSNAARVTNMEFVDGLVETWTKAHSIDQLVEVLNEASVPCAPVVALADVLTSPQTTARGMLNRHVEGDYEWWTLGSPVRLGASPAPERNVPHRLGEDTVEILMSRLGMSAEEISPLIDAGAVIQNSNPPRVPRSPSNEGRTNA